jgi:hypothetical protein
MPVTDLFDKPDVGHGITDVGTKVAEIDERPSNQIIDWIKRERHNAKPHVEAYRKQEKECRKFVDGKQMSDADRAALKAELRPDNAFNAVQKFIRFVSGVERMSPDALIFSPINENDDIQQQFGELVTRAYDWALAKTKGIYKRSMAFEDLLIGGMGWLDYRLEYSIDPSGLIEAERCPPQEMLWPETSAQNLGDARWLGRECYIDRDEACARWPDQEKLIKASLLINEKTGRPEADGLVRYTVPYIETLPIEEEQVSMFKKDKVKILEWEYYENEAGYYFFDPLEKNDAWFNKRDFAAYRKRLLTFKKMVVKDYVPRAKKKFHKIFLLNDRYQLGEILDMPCQQFTKACMTCHYDPDEKYFYGFAKLFIDPQRYANKFFNQVIEIIATSGKGGLLAEEGAIDPNKVEDIERKYAKPGSVTMFEPGAISQGKIKDKTVGQLPATAMQMVQYCISMMEDVSGIKPEASFGQGTQPVPGVTQKQRQRSGLLLLAGEFDSLDLFRITEGEVIFALLGELADDRLIRVGGPIDGQVVKLFRQPFSEKYDLSLDDTERDPNIRQLYQENIIQVLPTLLRMNVFPPELLDYFILPYKVKKSLKEAIVRIAQQQRQDAQQGISRGGRGAQVSPEQKAADLQKTQADTQLQAARAQKTLAQEERDKLKLVLEALMNQGKLKLEQARIAAEHELGRKNLAHDMISSMLDYSATTKAAKMKAEQSAKKEKSA